VRRHLAPRDFYFRRHGKPLVVTFVNGPMGECDALEEAVWQTEDIELRRLRAFFMGSDCWRSVDSYPQRLNKEWMSVCPGYDAYVEDASIARHVRQDEPLDLDVVRRKAFRADRENGAFFEKQLLRARHANPEIIFISGWNDWQYGRGSCKSRQRDPRNTRKHAKKPFVFRVISCVSWAFCERLGNHIEPAVEYGFQYVDMAARLLGREPETASYQR
jgi:hypothetical protein